MTLLPGAGCSGLTRLDWYLDRWGRRSASHHLDPRFARCAIDPGHAAAVLMGGRGPLREMMMNGMIAIAKMTIARRCFCPWNRQTGRAGRVLACWRRPARRAPGLPASGLNLVDSSLSLLNSFSLAPFYRRAGHRPVVVAAATIGLTQLRNRSRKSGSPRLSQPY